MLAVVLNTGKPCTGMYIMTSMRDIATLLTTQHELKVNNECLEEINIHKFMKALTLQIINMFTQICSCMNALAFCFTLSEHTHLRTRTTCSVGSAQSHSISIHTISTELLTLRSLDNFSLWMEQKLTMIGMHWQDCEDCTYWICSEGQERH